MPDKELTKAQQEQQDFVDNNIHGLLVGITGKEIEWDMEHISAVREAVQEVICDKLNLETEMEFYPYIADEEEPPDAEDEDKHKFYELDICLNGYGKTPDEAWQDAIEGFCQEPGATPDKSEYKIVGE